LARTLVLVGKDDPMRDEALNFAKRLSEAGIPVTSSVLPGASNWPEALYRPDDSGCAACEAVVQKHFREFFSAAPPPH
jgi:acetyl esterase